MFNYYVDGALKAQGITANAVKKRLKRMGLTKLPQLSSVAPTELYNVKVIPVIENKPYTDEFSTVVFTHVETTANQVIKHFTVKEKSLDTVRADYIAALREIRKSESEQYVEVAGVYVKVNSEAIMKVEGVVSGFKNGSLTTVNWVGYSKTLTGQYIGPTKLAINSLEEAVALQNAIDRAVIMFFTTQDRAEEEIMLSTLEELKSTSPADIYAKYVQI